MARPANAVLAFIGAQPRDQPLPYGSTLTRCGSASTASLRSTTSAPNGTGYRQPISHFRASQRGANLSTRLLDMSGKYAPVGVRAGAQETSGTVSNVDLALVTGL